MIRQQSVILTAFGSCKRWGVDCGVRDVQTFHASTRQIPSPPLPLSLLARLKSCRYSARLSHSASIKFIIYLPITMAARLSTRISLRWVPDEPEELTNTLVMNVGGYFMDLRVNKADQSIDWAMAGERQILSKNPRKFPAVSYCLVIP